MGRILYQIEIIISGGPTGYCYTDNYKTNIGSEISEIISQGYHLNKSISKESYERSRSVYLNRFEDGSMTTKEINIEYVKIYKSIKD